MNEFPSLRGVSPSWADIAVTSTIYDGPLLELVDIAAINWDRTVEVGEQRGASGGRVLSRTRGQLSQSASATLFMSGYLKLLRALMQVAPLRGDQRLVSLVGFDVEIQWSVPSSDEIFHVRLKGCRLLTDSNSNSEGTDAAQIEISLNPIEVVNVIDGVEVALL